MRAAQLLEHRGVGRKTSAGPTSPWQLELLEQQGLQLLGRVDPEVVPHRLVRLAFDPRDLARELLAERAEVREIDRDARLLHLDEHRDQRELHVPVQPLEAEPLELHSKLLTQTRRRDRARACTGDALIEGRRAERVLAIRDRKQRHLEMKALGREVLEGVVAPARVH